MTRRRRRRTRARRPALPRIPGRLARELGAIVLVLLAVVSVIALFAPDAGAIVRPWHDLLGHLLGWGIAFAPPILLGLALMLWTKARPFERWMSAFGMALAGLALLGIFHLVVGGSYAMVEEREGGGLVGYAVAAILQGALGAAGAWLTAIVLLVLGLLLYFNMSVGDLLAGYLERRDRRRAAEAAALAGRSGERARATRTDPEPEPAARRAGWLDRMRATIGLGEQEEPPIILRRERPSVGRGPSVPIPVETEPRVPVDGGDVGEPATTLTSEHLESDEERHLAELGQAPSPDAALEAAEQAWELPRLELLAEPAQAAMGQLDLAAKGQRIRETLAHFGIGVKVARIQEGPVVTQYALEVEPGIKLSRIEGLADNLSLALAARSIRIEAPIPGEPYVGVEIPNTAFDLVTLKEVLASSAFEELAAGSRLAFALGQDVAGQPFAADLAKMPHLLIAGATGSGKSVCVNAIICSLLMRATPREVKLIMLDPKRVELAQYKGLPHLLTEVIVDSDKAVNALRWTVGAMEARYHEFAQRGVRNIGGYNDSLRPGQPRMPYIVVVIDELADLMMVSAYEVEATITRIAQLARATGIHLVVATQRPSVQVITGLIKANIPSRIAFAMTSGVDSRTILDTTGAEDLLGRGDMLYQPIDAPRAVRLQGVLVTDAEIEALARHWRGQGAPRYRPEITAPRRDGRPGRAEEEEDGLDTLFGDAVDVVRRHDKASASLLQRRLKIGYARAARILDQMEERGIVGPPDGSRFRQVLVTTDGWGGEIGPDRIDE